MEWINLNDKHPLIEQKVLLANFADPDRALYALGYAGLFQVPSRSKMPVADIWLDVGLEKPNR